MKEQLLAEVRGVIHHPDPAGELQQVDRYIELYLKSPKTFVLPRQHAHLKELVRHYANAPVQFLHLVKHIRNEVRNQDKQSTRHEAMQEFLRLIVVRLKQREWRVRASAMNEWMSEHRLDLDYATRQRWIGQIKRHWSGKRMALLKAAQRAAGGRLAAEDREELLGVFWEQVDNEIARGDFPPYKEDDDGVELH